MVQVPMFRAYAYNNIKKLFLNSVLRDFAFGAILYNEGEKANSLFVIKEGFFKLSKEYAEDELIEKKADDTEFVGDGNGNGKAVLSQIYRGKPKHTFNAEVLFRSLWLKHLDSDFGYGRNFWRGRFISKSSTQLYCGVYMCKRARARDSPRRLRTYHYAR